MLRPFRIRSQLDTRCYLAIGNSTDGSNYLGPNETNVFFDCTEGGHFWIYQNGSNQYCNLPSCLGFFFYSTNFTGANGSIFNQLQWEWLNIGKGYKIGENESNVKLNAAKPDNSSRQWLINPILDEIYTWDTYNYDPPRKCILVHNTGNMDQYYKWISPLNGESTTSISGVLGYEAMINCTLGVQSFNTKILC